MAENPDIDSTTGLDMAENVDEDVGWKARHWEE